MNAQTQLTRPGIPSPYMNANSPACDSAVEERPINRAITEITSLASDLHNTFIRIENMLEPVLLGPRPEAPQAAVKEEFVDMSPIERRLRDIKQTLDALGSRMENLIGRGRS